MRHLLVIALGGGAGALSRYGLSTFINQAAGTIFPAGTLFVNVAGSFVIGFCFHLFDHTMVPSDVRAFLTIGFLGAFTTFSTYSLETMNLIRDGEFKLGLMNVVMNNIFGFGLLIAGMVCSNYFLKAIR